MSIIRFLRTLALGAAIVPQLAQAMPDDARTGSPDPAAASSVATDSPVGRSAGTVSLSGGQELRYRAVAESLPVRDDAGNTTAEIFMISYLAEESEAATRPITFLFNGGPGAASAFLMLGAAGPQVLATEADGTVPPPPARLEDNPASWLAFTDLAFVDPVGTGYSRATGSGTQANEPFWGVRGDVDALSEVVRLWLTRNDRWMSPKFLAGESYGAFRAVKLARALQREEGAGIGGLVLVSAPLEFALLDGDDHDLLPWAMRLPSMAAAAQSQGRAPSLPLEEVERFALSDYLVGLAALEPPDETPDSLDRRIAALTGLPADLVERHDARIPIELFAKELLRDSGRRLSLYDASVASPDPDPDERRLGPDPMLDGLVAPYSTALNALLGGAFGYDGERPYRLLNREVSRKWRWDEEHGGSRREAGVLDELESLMALDPQMRVLVAHGVYDLVTPYFASAWLLGRMELPDRVKGNASLRVYEGGHMPYMRPAERAKLARDVQALYESVLAGS